MAYADCARTAWDLKPSGVVIRFGDQHVASEGMMSVCFQSRGTFIALECHFVHAEVPMLLGLDVLRTFGLILDFDTHCLRSSNPSWSFLFTYSSGHAFISPVTLFSSASRTPLFNVQNGSERLEIHYTTTELRRLHLHYYHPSSQKLFALLHRADNNRVSRSVKEMLQKITASCEH